MSRLVVRGKQVVLPQGLQPASIYIADGLIESVQPYDAIPPDAELLDAGNLTVMPGLVDTHVHLNDPGRDYWEGFATGTKAAAAGGITTVVDMPLNSVPATTTCAGLNAKLAAAAGHCMVDVGLWGGVVPGNTADLEPLLAAGVLGFKCFLVHSGVDEFPAVGEADLRAAMPVLARHEAVLLAHAELPGPLAAANPQGSPRAYATYLASRPPAAEQEAIALLIQLCREFSVRTHVVHLAAAAAIPELTVARAAGLPLTVETCPHYLTFEAGKIADGATEYKCAPPIRDAANREQLWAALESGVIDLIATDHSPCPPAMKSLATGDFFEAWGGIASLQFSLAAVWTEAKRRAIPLTRVSAWLSAGPARLAGLAGRKGAIAPGTDADLIFFDPERTVDPAQAIEHRHKLTPYAGWPLHGVVERTVLRGETIYANGSFTSPPRGLILRSPLFDLNHAPVPSAEANLLRCCGSRRWAREMMERRPFASFGHLSQTAEEVAGRLLPEDWLEAFAAHPRIGDRQGSQWSRQEQSGVRDAAVSLGAELADMNEQYWQRFGFIFIICATGKSAPEMLGALKQRLNNSREAELGEAADQQRLITQIRLRKLLGL